MTRRPSVPKAQFAEGLGSSPTGSAGKDGAVPAARESAAQPATSAEMKKGRAATAKKRQPASASAPLGTDDADTGAAAHRPVPARSFSGRLLVLGLAMGVVTLLLAPNVHTYLEQRAEISALREDIAVREAQQEIYTSELARWDDPAYIKQQARDRVSMLMPGETGYWVYGAEELKAAEGAEPAASSTTAKDATSVTEKPWVDSLVEAVQKSAQVQAPPADPAPAPADPAPSEPAPAPAP